MSRCGILSSLAVASVCLTAAVASEAELYKWTDENGVLRVTQDLSQVPGEYRAKALAASRKQSKFHTYDPGDSSTQGAAAAPPAHYSLTSRLARSGPVRVPFKKWGGVMLVEAKVNGRVTVPFIVDSGASGVSIPYAYAEQLGIRIDEDTPRRTSITANGRVSEPVVRLLSVELGGARVDNLEASVSGSMQVGLLGGLFFNNYVYQVDGAAHEIVLTPNDRVVGGYTEAQWRKRFLDLREPLARLDEALARGGFLDEERVKELEGYQVSLRNKLSELEIEASRSQVPQAWRH